MLYLLQLVLEVGLGAAVVRDVRARRVVREDKALASLVALELLDTECWC